MAGRPPDRTDSDALLRLHVVHRPYWFDRDWAVSSVRWLCLDIFSPKKIIAKISGAAKAAVKKWRTVVSRASTQAAVTSSTPAAATSSTQASASLAGILLPYEDFYEPYEDDVDPLPLYVYAAQDDFNNYLDVPAYAFWNPADDYPQQQRQHHVEDGVRFAPLQAFHTSRTRNPFSVLAPRIMRLHRSYLVFMALRAGSTRRVCSASIVDASSLPSSRLRPRSMSFKMHSAIHRAQNAPVNPHALCPYIRSFSLSRTFLSTHSSNPRLQDYVVPARCASLSPTPSTCTHGGAASRGDAYRCTRVVSDAAHPQPFSQTRPQAAIAYVPANPHLTSPHSTTLFPLFAAQATGRQLDRVGVVLPKPGLSSRHCLRRIRQARTSGIHGVVSVSPTGAPNADLPHRLVVRRMQARTSATSRRKFSLAMIPAPPHADSRELLYTSGRRQSDLAPAAWVVDGVCGTISVALSSADAEEAQEGRIVWSARTEAQEEKVGDQAPPVGQYLAILDELESE
ncbi:hypothetical protein DFH06DRAFT_1337883 [Mycena polygramma]|nr:hypothetical protein DFH06DRAFT_1337883 [Mycena polygramma]